MVDAAVQIIRRWAGIGFTLMLLALGSAVYARSEAEAEAGPDRDEAYESLAVFTRALEQIREVYVEQEKVGYRDLIYGAIRGMLETLDEHSQFMDPDAFADLQDDAAGQFGGLGIVVGIREGTLTIVSPIEDTPGFKAGLLAGDRILEIDDKSTHGMTLADAVKKLRGAPGTAVRLTVARPGAAESRTVELVRAVISPPTIAGARMLEEGIAYLRIVQFTDPTPDAFAETLRELRDQGMQALVIDLRNNPGGVLGSAVRVAQQLLPRGRPVVLTQGRREEDRQTFRSRGIGRRRTDLPLVLLINEGTASAAEILAGALKDNGRAVLIGERSFGKGSVQSVLPLDDGSALRLTTARYYTPGERVIDGRGLDPDIEVSMSEEDWLRLTRWWSGLPSRENQTDNRDPMPEDVQLERALDVLRGVLLFRAHVAPLAQATG